MSGFPVFRYKSSPPADGCGLFATAGAIPPEAVSAADSFFSPCWCFHQQVETLKKYSALVGVFTNKILIYIANYFFSPCWCFHQQDFDFALQIICDYNFFIQRLLVKTPTRATIKHLLVKTPTRASIKRLLVKTPTRATNHLCRLGPLCPLKSRKKAEE